jgi:hypothetical protein
VKDEKLKNPTKVVNAINNFFITLIEKWNIQQVEKGDATSILKDLFPQNFSSIKIIPITENEIKSLKQAPPKKSSDYDEITSKILKACASRISHPLRYIYNHSLYTGIIPDHLKIAVVKPLYTKRNKTSMKNYRPVSLLTVLSKVLKKAMPSRLR